jgi:hypothetical protein
MATSEKIAVSLDAEPYFLVEIDRRFVAAVDERSDGGGSKHLWNVGQYVLDYTAQHHRRQPS